MTSEQLLSEFCLNYVDGHKKLQHLFAPRSLATLPTTLTTARQFLLSCLCSPPFLVPSTICSRDRIQNNCAHCYSEWAFLLARWTIEIVFCIFAYCYYLICTILPPTFGDGVPLFSRSGANGGSHYQNDHPHPLHREMLTHNKTIKDNKSGWDA